MTRPSTRVPLTPKEGWLSDGRQVLRFRPTRWQHTCQRLEITTGELLPDQEIPLLKSRRELSRAGRPAAPNGDRHLRPNRFTPTKLSSEPMAPSLPMSSTHQPRRYRLVDHHGQPHLELDEHCDSIEEAWAFATHWWQQQRPSGEPATQIGLGLEVGTESGSWRTLRHPQG